MDLSIYLIHFALVSFVVALATAAIRLHDPRMIVAETWRFFLTIVVGIGVFACLVWGLGWLFVG